MIVGHIELLSESLTSKNNLYEKLECTRLAQFNILPWTIPLRRNFVGTPISSHMRIICMIWSLTKSDFFKYFLSIKVSYHERDPFHNWWAYTAHAPQVHLKFSDTWTHFGLKNISSSIWPKFYWLISIHISWRTTMSLLILIIVSFKWSWSNL